VEAKQVLLDGLRTYPDSIDLLTELAELASSRKDWPLAAGRWGAVLDAHGGRAPAHSLVRTVFALLSAGSFEEAEQVAHAGLRILAMHR